MLSHFAKTGAFVAMCSLLFVGVGSYATEGAERLAAPAIPTVLLVEPADATPLDGQIHACQLRLQRTAMPGAELERLGWLFIAKARASADPGFYTLAGIAADTLEQRFGFDRQAWLLRGHVLQTRHRFAEAEALARRLIVARGDAADYALLGDALYDQGRITDAAAAYQRMVDLKPSQDSYARAANIHWIKGDLLGAVELQTLAVRSGGVGDAGATAWNLCRLGQLVWQQGKAADAMTLAKRALELVPDFQPALLLQGRLLLARGNATEALVPLARTVEILPLPEPYWVYADALRAAGRESDAVEIEARLVREGSAEDPRTVALFLATHRRDGATAVQLAMAELNNRADIFTHSASALALANVGRMDEALLQQHAALAEGTIDARLLLHAGRIAALAHKADAAELLERARAFTEQLLPSERQLLEESLSLLSARSISRGDLNKNTHQNPS